MQKKFAKKLRLERVAQLKEKFVAKKMRLEKAARLQSQLKEKLKLKQTGELKKEIDEKSFVVKQEKIEDVLELDDLLSNLSG